MQQYGTIIAGVLGVCLVGALGGGWYLYQKYEDLQESHQALGDAYETQRVTSSETVTALENQITELTLLLGSTTAELDTTRAHRDTLNKDLTEEKERNDAFEEQISDITGTVGKLDKLAKTDKELLQKYSKVYFLNEHYIPERLTEIEDAYLYREDDPTFLHARVMPFLEDMLNDALEDGIKIWVVSGYRSYDEQKDLKGAYTVTYGSGANTFSADQGYSEHQLGTTIDFTTEGLGGGLSGFENTPAYTWLLKHAHRYGFVLSYPKDNAYYIFEPWHWRFVGTDLAEDLHEGEKHFYDLEQREIDKYLISIFD